MQKYSATSKSHTLILYLGKSISIKIKVLIRQSSIFQENVFYWIGIDVLCTDVLMCSSLKLVKVV